MKYLYFKPFIKLQSSAYSGKIWSYQQEISNYIAQLASKMVLIFACQPKKYTYNWARTKKLDSFGIYTLWPNYWCQKITKKVENIAIGTIYFQ